MTAKFFSEPPKEIPDLQTLKDVLIFEIIDHFKLQDKSLISEAIREFGRKPALRFAEMMQRFDRLVAEMSIYEAACDVLRRLTGGYSVKQAELIPHDGPLLVVANHPGGADSMAAMASLKRDDQHLLVNERPMLRAMPNASRHLIYIDEASPTKFDIMRRVINLLQSGESVIIFPRGNLEPDPMLYPGALDAIKLWSKSVGVFLNKVPETILQPLIISNVVVPQAWQSLLAKMAANNIKRRHQIAMIYQTARQLISPKDGWNPIVNISAVKSVTAKELASSLNIDQLNQALQTYIGEQMLKEFPDLALASD